MNKQAKFYIYRNLHLKNFSVRFRGRVKLRSANLIAHDVSFKVNEGGRRRTIQNHERNVHAFAVTKNLGSYAKSLPVANLKEIKYNPFQSGHFLVDGKPILQAKTVIFTNGKAYLREEMS